MDLHRWGWNAPLQQAFDGLDTPGLVPARVLRHDRTGYLVLSPDGEAFARLVSHLRRDAPAVGDWVALDPHEPPTIRALLPRTHAIVRQAPGTEARPQVIAANVDILFIVVGLDNDLNARRIERYLVLAASAGARPIVVLNKADIADAPEAPPDVETLVTSATTGAGVDAIRALIPAGVTAAFVGPSGVGKSSLVNRLLGANALATGDVRASDHKGRHTTTARHLLPIPHGGIVLDTPGMREIALWDANEGVASVFSDIESAAAACRFRDCRHAGEPGCAVRDAVSEERLDAWRKLQREATAAARKADVRAARQDGRAFGKMARGAQRAKRDRLS